MPKEDEIVPNFVSYSSKVLIVNELGGFASHLVDSLLTLGCQIFYLGDKKNDFVDHLLNKVNFKSLDKINQIQDLNTLNYIFYLADKRKKYLPDFFRISQEKKIKFLFLWQGDFSTSEQILKEIIDRKIDGRVCLFQEVYGPRIFRGEVSKLISEVVLNKKVKLIVEKDLEIHLIYISDLTKGLIWSILSPETSEKMIDLRGEKISLVSLVSEVQKKAERVINVEFKEIVKNLSQEESLKEKDHKLDWKPEVSLTFGVEETINWFKNPKNLFSISETGRKRISFPRIISNKKRLVLGLGIFCFLVTFFFILPVVVFLRILILAKGETLAAQKAFKELNFTVAKNKVVGASQKVYFAERMFEMGSPFYEVFGFEDDLNQFGSLLSVWEKLLNSAEGVLSLKDLFLPNFAAILKGEKSTLETDLPQMNNLLEKVYTEISLASVLVDKIHSDGFLIKKFSLAENLVPPGNYLADLRKEIYQAKMILPLLPEMFGLKDKKYYLLLLQNNFELRPTGGLLGGYGLLVFEKGRLIDIEIKNTALIDEKLYGQVEPPEKLKNYLGIVRWYLRDANWDPDYQISAQKIEWFFEKETGRVVDGVFAVDLNIARKVLAEVGEIFLEDYKEKINQQNFFDRAVYFSESGPFPGAEQKFDYFALCAKALFEEVKKQPDLFFLKLGEIIHFSLAQKDLLLYFHEPRIKELTRLFNWDGAIQPNLACQKISENCLPDYLFINEANLGANRTNYFLRRLINHQVTLNTQGSIKEKLKVTYQNLSLSESWPGGQYKAYVRLYLPALANFENIMLNDASDPSYWVQIPPTKIDIYRDRTWLVVGFLLEVPVKSQRTVEVNYFLPGSADLKKEFTYTLLVTKQPGANETLYSFNLNFSDPLKPLRILPKGTFSENRILVNDSLDQDKLIRVDFGR